MKRHFIFGKSRKTYRFLTVLLSLMLIAVPLLGCSDSAVDTATDIALELLEEDADESEDSQAEASSEQMKESKEDEAAADEEASVTTGSSDTEVTLEAANTSDTAEASETTKGNEQRQAAAIDQNGTYNSKGDVALYLHTYGRLPSNYITKKEAKALGWSGGSVEAYAPGKSIGGDYYGNYEGVLPDVDGEDYHECDIDTLGKSSRGAKRIIYSTDGRIYYTEDHYESFEQLY